MISLNDPLKVEMPGLAAGCTFAALVGGSLTGLTPTSWIAQEIRDLRDEGLIDAL